MNMDEFEHLMFWLGFGTIVLIVVSTLAIACCIEGCIKMFTAIYRRCSSIRESNSSWRYVNRSSSTPSEDIPMFVIPRFRPVEEGKYAVLQPQAPVILSSFPLRPPGTKSPYSVSRLLPGEENAYAISTLPR